MTTPTDPDAEHRYRRAVLGITAVGCLVAAPIAASSRGYSHMLPAGMIRIGIVCGAAWLAYPQLRRLSARSFRKGGMLLLLGGLVLVALRPIVFAPMLLAVVVLTWWRRRKAG